MTTEWEDALRRHGVLPPLEHEVNVEEDLLEKLILEQAARKASHVDDTDEELAEHIDNASDDDEESELLRIRRRRMAELKARQQKQFFGDCLEISKSQFVSEVSEDSKSHNVLILIFTRGDTKGLRLQSLFAQVAEKCKDVKFLYMQEEKTVTPMIVAYEKGEPVFTARPDASSVREADELEWVMAQQGLVKTDLQEDPRLHSGNHRISINIHRKERSGYSGAA